MRGPDCLHDGIDQVMRSIEVGSCSLQEEQMLRRSVEALIRRRERHGDRLPHAPGLGFAAPHERQPGLPERGVVRRPTPERLGDAGIRPDITPGELPGRANQCTRDQAGHRRVNLHLRNRQSHFAAGAATSIEPLSRQSIMTQESERRLNLMFDWPPRPRRGGRQPADIPFAVPAIPG